MTISPHVEAVGGIYGKFPDNRIAIVFLTLDGALLAPVQVIRDGDGLSVTTIDWWIDAKSGKTIYASEVFGGISLDDPCVTPLATERIVAAAFDYVRRKGLA